MINEQSRRRPGFTDGGAVVLADGQSWHFPAIRLRLRAATAADGSIAPGVSYTAAGVPLPDYERWRRAITSPPGAIPGDVYWTARLTAAAAMLRANYLVADVELGELLVWDQDDAASLERWDAVNAAVLGLSAPKPAPAG